MAVIERIIISSPQSPLLDEEIPTIVLAGLRISSRATTASLSDYPEWNNDQDSVVSDGACS